MLASARNPVLDTWLPENGDRALILRWTLSEWCNYRCSYCPQTHDRHVLKGNGMSAHGFDNFPVESWLDAFAHHFSHSRLSVVLTGGEPMLDRKAMVPLLNLMTGMPRLDCIRIDTNAHWKPSAYSEINPAKIILMCTYHPASTTEDKFFQNIADIQKAGFTIGMINYVMTEENVLSYPRLRKRAADELGVPLHPNPLWESDGKYSRSMTKMLKAELPTLDFQYRAQIVSPKGKNCLFPAIGYEMDYLGNIHVGCFSQRSGSFFDKELPELFAEATRCPHDTCCCLDKYTFLEGITRNTTLNPLAVYSEILKVREDHQCENISLRSRLAKAVHSIFGTRPRSGGA